MPRNVQVNPVTASRLRAITLWNSRKTTTARTAKKAARIHPLETLRSFTSEAYWPLAAFGSTPGERGVEGDLDVARQRLRDRASLLGGAGQLLEGVGWAVEHGAHHREVHGDDAP